jgi:uncharacterized membrane protein YwaF
MNAKLSNLDRWQIAAVAFLSLGLLSAFMAATMGRGKQWISDGFSPVQAEALDKLGEWAGYVGLISFVAVFVTAILRWFNHKSRA